MGGDGIEFVAKYGVLVWAEMMAVTALAPLERCKLILQTQALIKVPSMDRYPGFLFFLQTTPKKESFLRFWRGNMSSLSKILVSTTLRYPLLPLLAPNLPTQAGFGLFTLAVVYPLDLARTRLAIDITRKGETPIYEGLTDTLRKTVSDEGIFGMYKGFSVAAFSLLSLLVLENLLAGPVQRRLKPHSESMLEDQIKKHSVSMGIAQMLIYPVDTVRRSMQAGGSRMHEKMEGVKDCCQRIYHSEGFLGFYRGCLLNALRLPPTLAIFYYLSDFARISPH